jgi:hypothetical protein
VRRRFDQRFSATAMARGYLSLYAERLAADPSAIPQVPANALATQAPEEDKSFARYA